MEIPASCWKLCRSTFSSFRQLRHKLSAQESQEVGPGPGLCWTLISQFASIHCYCFKHIYNFEDRGRVVLVQHRPEQGTLNSPRGTPDTVRS